MSHKKAAIGYIFEPQTPKNLFKLAATYACLAVGGAAAHLTVVSGLVTYSNPTLGHALTTLAGAMITGLCGYGIYKNERGRRTPQP